MKNKKKVKKIIKYSIIALVVILVFVSLFMIYKNVFSKTQTSRYEGIENYKLTKEEKSSVKEVLNTIGNIDNIKIYTTSKIIKIFITLKEDVDFNTVKSVSNQSIEKFSKENLSYYDVEIFVESKNENSEVYPQIGYKYKLGNEFEW